MSDVRSVIELKETLRESLQFNRDCLERLMQTEESDEFLRGRNAQIRDTLAILLDIEEELNSDDS